MPTVWFVNRVFPPAAGATGLYLAELADALARRGWRVHVVTGPARGSDGRPAPRRETLASGVAVARTGGRAQARRGLAARALAYAGLYPRLVAEARRLAREAGRPHAVVLKSDPPMLVTLGPVLRRLTGARVVHWAQDVYPDVALALGVLPAPAADALGALAGRALRAADAVVVIGRCMAERLARRGLEPSALAVIPNWAPAGVHPVPRDANPFRAEHGLDGRFVVLYSGNLGLAHPFEAILDAAERLAASGPQALFVFVGDGPRRAWVEAEAARRALPNVRFLPFQPRERLAESLSAADVHLVAMEPHLVGLVVPSKVYGALASGRPVVFLGPPASEAARVVEENACGTIVPEPDAPGAGATLADALAGWMADPEAAAAGRRAAAAAPAGPEAAADAFADVLARVVGRVSEKDQEGGSRGVDGAVPGVSASGTDALDLLPPA